MNFWRRKEDSHRLAIPYSEAAGVVSRIGATYAEQVEAGEFVKRAAILPCSVEFAKDCFKTAYEIEYPTMEVKIKDFYQHVYSEMAYFIDDGTYKAYATFLDIVVQNRISWESRLGRVGDQAFYRNLIAGIHTQLKTREEIWEELRKNEKDCKNADLIVLAEVLGYCASTFRALSGEWAAFANFVAFRHKLGKVCKGVLRNGS
jgi:hypothetical protein